MKKYYSFIFIALIEVSRLSGQASIYHPFPDSGAIWQTADIDIPGCIPNPCDYLIYELGKDTIYNGFKYRQFLRGELDFTVDGIQYFPPAFRGEYIRDDTAEKKVYYNYLLQGEDLFYDFDLKIGEMLPKTKFSDPSDSVKVIGIDSVQLLDGTFRKRFKLNSILASSVFDSLSLIEGIGYTGGLMQQIGTFLGFEGGHHLACFTDGQSTLYNWPPLRLTDCSLPTGINPPPVQNTTLVPNPAQNQVNLSFPFSNNIITISDLFGRELEQFKVANGNSKLIDLSFLQQGVYIVEIKDEKGILIAEKKLFKE